MRDHKSHASRPNNFGVRQIFRYTSLRSCVGGKNYLGKIHMDWVPRNESTNDMVYGYHWQDLAEDCGKTFVRLRDALADFDREMGERRKENNAKTETT